MRRMTRYLAATAFALAVACASTRDDWELLGRKDVSFLVERDTVDRLPLSQDLGNLPAGDGLGLRPVNDPNFRESERRDRAFGRA
jgi:hypothetical protein